MVGARARVTDDRRLGRAGDGRHAAIRAFLGLCRRQEEALWLVAVLAATIFLTEIPFVLAYARTADGLVFRGLFWLPYDVPQYLAAMREGAGSASWLIHDHLTGEAHQPVLMYVLYVAMGKVAGLFHWPIPAVFHVTQILARMATLATIYLFSSAVLPTVRQRRLALLLTICGSGMFLGAAKLGVAVFMTDEVNAFALLFAAPHLMLGLCSFLLALRWYLAAWSHRRWLHAAVCAAAVVGVAVSNSFSLVTLGAAVGVHVLAMWLRLRRVPAYALACTVAMALVAGPFLLYSVRTFTLDPFWGVVYGRQNITPAPSPMIVALCVLPLLVFAAAGIPVWMRDLTPGRTLVLVWAATTLCLMYVPVGVQYRFGIGLTTALGVVAAVGFERCWAVVRRQYVRARPLVRIALLSAATVSGAATFLSPAILLALNVHNATLPAREAERSAMFEPASVVQAASWLATVQTADDVVLALPLTGNELADTIPGRVYVGHGMATLDFPAKQRAAEMFYQAGGSRQDREAFLAANHIRYVFDGPEERDLSVVAPFAGLALHVVYQAGDVTIFQAAT